jgi:hypothetical protein
MSACICVFIYLRILVGRNYTGTGHIKSINTRTFIYLGSILKSSSATISEIETIIRNVAGVIAMLNSVL